MQHLTRIKRSHNHLTVQTGDEKLLKHIIVTWLMYWAMSCLSDESWTKILKKWNACAWGRSTNTDFISNVTPQSKEDLAISSNCDMYMWSSGWNENIMLLSAMCSVHHCTSPLKSTYFYSFWFYMRLEEPFQWMWNRITWNLKMVSSFILELNILLCVKTRHQTPEKVFGSHN